jgi:hypothetical protein
MIPDPIDLREAETGRLVPIGVLDLRQINDIKDEGRVMIWQATGGSMASPRSSKRESDDNNS